MAKSNKTHPRRRRRINQDQTPASVSAPETPTFHAERSADLRQSLMILGLLTLLGLVAYGNGLGAGFVLDDHSIIVNNPRIRSLDEAPALFATGYWEREGYRRGHTYRPLAMLTYALNYAANGLNAFVFHLTNLLLHIAVCWLLYLLGRQLGLSAVTALIASALFAVHPLNTEAVTGVVGRAELMMAAGVLLAVVLDIRRNSMHEPATRISPGSTLAFWAALLSKEQAVMLPALLLVCDMLRLRGHKTVWLACLWRARSRYLVLAATIAAYLSVRYWVLPGILATEVGFVENPLAHTDFLTRIMTATKVAGQYLWLVLWPAKLSIDYSYNAIPLVTSFSDAGMLFGALTWLALCTIGIFGFRRNNLPLTVGVSITVFFFAPTSNLIAPIGTIMGERLFYLPLAGLCLAAGAGLERLRAHARGGQWHRVQWAGVGAIAIVVILLGLRTVARNRDWKEDFTLFQRAVAVNPAASKSHLLLGAALARQGRTVESIAEMEKAAAIYPEYRLRHTFAEEMGNMLLASGRADDALTLVKQALEAEPDYPALLNIYGQALQQREQWEEAIAMHERALEVTKQVGGENTVAFVNGLYHLARAYTFQGRYGEADAALEQAIEIIDNSVSADVTTRDVARFVSFRAIVVSAQGDYGTAQPLFQRLISIIAASETPQDFRSLVQPLASYAAYLHEANRDTAAQAVERQLQRISRSP